RRVSETDESLASFTRRRLGAEVLDYAVAPFVGGVFAGDPEQLSARHSFERLVRWEQEHGSLVWGALRAAGGDAETRLVFTHDEEQTFERVAEEAGCDAILVPNPATAVERLLVAVRGEADAGRIAAFVGSLIGDRDISVTVYHVAGPDEDLGPGETLVEEAVGTLRDAGLPAGAIGREIERTEAPVRAIATAAADYGAVVMGESEPSLRTFLLGESHEAVAARSLGPVLVVRRAREADAG
ncbi:MAG: universal stress protein, partial [Halobacteriales archaeon]